MKRRSDSLVSRIVIVTPLRSVSRKPRRRLATISRFVVSLVCLAVFLPLPLAAVSAELNERNSGFLNQLRVPERVEEWKEPSKAATMSPAHQTTIDAPAVSVQHFYPQEILEANSGLELSFNLSASSSSSSSNDFQITERRPSKVLLRLNLAGCGPVLIQLKDSQTKRWSVSSCSLSPSKLSSDWSKSKNWVHLDVSEAVFFDQNTTLRFTLAFSPFIYLSGRRDEAVSLLAIYDVIPSPTNRSKRLAHEPNSTANASPDRRGGKGKGKGGRKRLGKDRNAHPGHHSRQSHRRLCQRVDLYVDFKELNWDDWILSPMGYNAYMCVGECPNPLPAKLNATNHAIVQSLINSLNPDVPGACCVATETSALNILYKDFNNTIQIKKYERMRVEACGCR